MAFVERGDFGDGAGSRHAPAARAEVLVILPGWRYLVLPKAEELAWKHIMLDLFFFLFFFF